MTTAGMTYAIKKAIIRSVNTLSDDKDKYKLKKAMGKDTPRLWGEQTGTLHIVRGVAEELAKLWNKQEEDIAGIQQEIKKIKQHLGI
jgi:hypothetical protein